MKSGIALTDLAVELKRQRDSKVDYLADTQNVSVSYGTNGPHTIQLDGIPGDLPVRDIAHRQLGQFAGIQASYYDKMRKDAPHLLCHNLNTWFGATPDTKLVRTLDGDLRAFLSKTYRTMDNYDCFEAVYPILQRNRLEIQSCQITERKLYIKAVALDREVEVKAEGTYRGDGGNNPIHVLRPGIVISNSETGFSSVSIKPAIHDQECSNMAVFSKDTARKIHVQSAANVSGTVQEFIKDDTRRAADVVFWKTVRDLTEAALEGALFDKYVNDVRTSMGVAIEGNPAKVVQVLAKDMSITEKESDGIIEALIKSGEPTKFGVQAAITAVSQKIEDYDRASELEEIGGKIIELNPTQWKRIETMAVAA